MVNPFTTLRVFDRAMRSVGYPEVKHNSLLQEAASHGFPAMEFNVTNPLHAAILYRISSFAIRCCLVGEQEDDKHS